MARLSLQSVAARDVLGIGGAILATAGVWGLWGWQWAAIAAGVPLVALYVWAELKEAR